MERTQLIAAREHLKISRPELAKRLGVARTFVFKVEMGYQDLRAPMMRKWLEILGPGVSMDVFRPPPRSAAE